MSCASSAVHVAARPIVRAAPCACLDARRAPPPLQIVALQTMLERMASSFPGSFAGYHLSVAESHQKSKVDTSGTARAVVESLRRLGPEAFADEDIQLIRDDDAAVQVMGVPRDALGGHAFHTYTLTSADGSVEIQFRHNVVGHRVYADGSVDAVRFLARRIAQHAEQRLYNMVDVLEEGAMR